MSIPATKALKLYASYVLPDIIKEKAPIIPHLLYRWLKNWWNTISHKERGAFRRHMRSGKPLPAYLHKLISGCGIPLEWPPTPKDKPKPVRRYGKPHAWKHQHYGRGKYNER